MSVRRVYMDGIFDLFHIGHLNAIKQMKDYGTYTIIGVVSDVDATSYKREPVIPEEHRVEMIKQCKYVNEVIFPCPMVLTPDFIESNHIDLVVHAFKDEADYQKQHKFFKDVNLCIVPYSTLESTTDIIERVKKCN